MNSKIIYISSIDLTNYNSKIFGIDYLKKKKFECRILVFSISFTKLKKNLKDIVNSSFKKNINSIYDFKKKLYK